LSVSTSSYDIIKGDSSDDQEMLASVLFDVARLEVRVVPRPRVSQGEVLVRVTAVGLCGTDSHIFLGHANYNTDKRGVPIPLVIQPQILGHEISGVIAEIGAGVHDLAIGDRVVLDQGLNCHSLSRVPICEYCQTGDSHQCEFYGEHGITGLFGGLAEYISVPAVNAIAFQSTLDSVEAAMVEPLGCVIHSLDAVRLACTRFTLNADSTQRPVGNTLVCGAGPAGLLFVQYLRRVLRYDGRLIVSEPNAFKRKLASKFGVDEVLDPSGCDLVESVKDLTGGKGVEFLIEASGAGQVLASAPGLIRKQATVLLYGHGHAGVDLSVLNNVMFREPTIITPVGASGGFDPDRRPTVHRRALRLIEQGQIDVGSIITHRYSSLDAVQNALASDINDSEYIKGVVGLSQTGG
jgi:threonine dehydrogenase-like Zn-dependent dehydrogenase